MTDTGETMGLRETVAHLRRLGWSVAAHNDYRLAGEPHTFWLWTHASGRWIKGEGRTDEEALSACRDEAERLIALPQLAAQQARIVELEAEVARLTGHQRRDEDLLP